MTIKKHKSARGNVSRVDNKNSSRFAELQAGAKKNPATNMRSDSAEGLQKRISNTNLARVIKPITRRG